MSRPRGSVTLQVRVSPFSVITTVAVSLPS